MLSPVNVTRMAVLPGIYAGFDGKYVKLGVAGGRGGLRARLASYRTHNPAFEIVAFVPAEILNARSYDDLDHLERALLIPLQIHAVSPLSHRASAYREWFRPTPEVRRVVGELRQQTDAALRLASENFDALCGAYNYGRSSGRQTGDLRC